MFLFTVDAIGTIFISCCLSLLIIIAADCISFDLTQLSILKFQFKNDENFKKKLKNSYILLINGRPNAPQDHGLPWSGLREKLSLLLNVINFINSHI